MSISRKIFVGCLALTGLTLLLGIYAQLVERRLGDLATGFYDDAFMSVSYLRSAQVEFAGLDHAAPPAEAARSVLDDLEVAEQRAMSPTGRAQAAALRQRLGVLLAGPTRRREELAGIQSAFEAVVETFAADGFQYRRRIEAMVATELQRSWAADAVLLLAAIGITALVSRLIAPPVRRAVRVAQAIAAGRLDTPIEISGHGETADLLRALSIMQGSIASAMARITALMAAQAESHADEIAGQDRRMAAALDNMNQGLCLFDADGRLAVSNRRFAEMFGIPRLGMAYPDLLAHAGLAGMLDATQQHRIEALSCDLPNGHVIAIAQQAVAGGGWVATYEDVSEQRQAEQRLAHLARHDQLTGLANRLLFTEQGTHALAQVGREGPLALMVLDLDGFRAVNDTLGHAVGDLLLCAAAERIERNIREQDLLARLGADEFVIIQRSADQPEEATALAGRMIAILGEPFEIEGNLLAIGASAGIALSDDAPGSIEALLSCAGMALDRARAEGRGMWRCFELEMDARLQRRRALELELATALSEEQFEVFYQPLVSREGRIVGFEALLRWRHPERGLISPAVFIPVAEETGLIIPMGAWVLHRACADAAGWPAPLKVAVNLSPIQFRDACLADEVRHALAESGLPVGRLEMEVTESVMLQEDATVLAILHDIRGMGVRIAMDDFGTGYSSLAYLSRFPFDKIKIDQSFVRDMAERPDCLAIVRAVIGLGRSLGMLVNAEGVETTRQQTMLCDEGCDELQGYLFSKPQPNAAVAGLLARHGCAVEFA